MPAPGSPEAGSVPLRRLERWAWLPIPVLAAAMVVAWVSGIQAAWRFPGLFRLLAYGPAALAVGMIAVPAARRFLADGQASVLMLGCGMWLSSLGVVGGALGAARSLDCNWAIYNTAHLLAGLCHLAGVATAERPRVPPDRGATWLAAAYGGGLAAVGLAAWAAATGRMPAFHVPGEGGTLLRGLVVGATVALFATTASLLWQTRRRTRSAFFHWYALGLTLLATAFAGSLLIAAADSPLQWLTRATRAWGTVYLCVAILAGRGAGGAQPLPLAAVAPAWRERIARANRDRPALARGCLRYGLAPAAVAAGTLAQLAVAAWCGTGLPVYLTSFPAVMVTSLLAGFGPGLLATALAVLCVAYGFLPPAGRLLVASAPDRLGLAMFAAMGVFISVVARIYRAARDKAAAYDREAARRESEERLEEAQRIAHIGNWEWTAETDAVAGSAEFRRIYGLDPAAGPPPAFRAQQGRCYPGDAWDQLRAAFDAALRTGAGFQMDLPALRAGRPIWVALRSEVVRDAGGAVRGLRGTVQDITERKAMEQALQEEGRRKDDFLALLGHELRNPLAPIGYAVHLLRAPGRDPGLLDSACGVIERQVAHMGRLVDDLLNISRITHGKIQLKLEAIDLEEVVRAVAGDYGQMLREHELTLSTRFGGRPLPMQADRARIVQSVSNLIHNAVKFTPPGGRVEVEAGPGRPGWARIQVRDTGRGIAPELMGALFQPFRQGPGSHGGLGLGLALVRGLAGLHGGTVTARSDGPGRGSEFTLDLPLAGTADPAVRPVPPAPAGPGDPCRILVVEDLEDSALALQRLLEVLGHTVAVARDGPAGLDLANRFRPDLVLCDIGLPGGCDGHAVARSLRATPDLARIRLVALSGYGTPEDKAKAAQAGFDAHLTKPVDPAILGALIAGLASGPAAAR